MMDFVMPGAGIQPLLTAKRKPRTGPNADQQQQKYLRSRLNRLSVGGVLMVVLLNIGCALLRVVKLIAYLAG